MRQEKNICNQFRDSFNNIVIYRQIINDPVCGAMYRLTSPPGLYPAESYLETVSFLISSLYEKVELNKETPVGNPWQNYLLDLIISDENLFTKKAAQSPFPDFNTDLIEVVSWDLSNLNSLLMLDFEQLCLDQGDLDQAPVIKKYLKKALQKYPQPASQKSDETSQSIFYKHKKYLFEHGNWGELAGYMADFHYTNGSGLFCLFHALRWAGKKGFQGITCPDPVRLENLVGYEAERNEVLKNTERLLAGLPASNMLLYGDRGTGKSSTVKALVHRYGKEGLRVVEVPKNSLRDYPGIISTLRNNHQKYILFVDDLSFEEHEVEYKEIKAILEGGLEAAPGNVVLYVTSNRRHLVKEFFSDRQQESMEIRQSDTIQEKLSLADRFGITVLFPAPDQMLFLEIVSGLANQRGIKIPPDDLRRKALVWEQWHNGRSARTARQFVDSLTT